MVQLTVGNSYSKITGLSAAYEKALMNALSYSVDAKAAYFSGGRGPRKKYLLSKRGEFPTGLMHRVLDFLAKAKVPFETLEGRKMPGYSSNINIIKPLTPYHAQIAAANAAARFGRGCISMPTGSGKSLVIALIAARLNVRTLVVVPNLGIKKQLTESLRDVLGPNPCITVENIDSRALETASDYSCLIIDEAHHVAAKTYQRLNKKVWNGIFYRFFLTATPFRNNTEETLLYESIAGEVIYDLPYKDAVSKGYILPVEAYYCEIPSTKNDCHMWTEVYSELVVHNDTRNHKICSLLHQLHTAKQNTLCLVKEVAHGKILAAATGLPFAYGSNDETEELKQQFNRGQIKTLIATTAILGEGIDTKPCEWVIIAGLGKAKSAFMQQVGRAIRVMHGKESAKVILFKDKSHKYTLKHFKEQVKILKEEYGIEPTLLD